VGDIQLPVEINMNNTSAIQLANNLEFHQRSKHIDVAYHLAREHVQSGFLKLNYVPSSDQLADGLTKPLASAKHEDMRKSFSMRHKEKVKMDSGFSIRGLFTALLTVLMTVPSSLSSLTAANSVIWRPTNTPVIDGYTNVHVFIKLETPCIVFNGTVHPELQNIFYSRCEEMYNTYFLEEIQKLCSLKTLSQHDIQKRLAITMGILVAVVIASIGVGAVGVGASYKLNNEVHGTQDVLEQQRSILEASTENIKILGERFNHMNKTVGTVIEKLGDLRDDHELLKQSLMDSIFGASFLTSKFMTCQQVMKLAGREWKKGKLYEPLLDYFNYTMPCGTSCPMELASPRRCSLSTDLKKVHLEFTVLSTTDKWQVVEADPFEITNVCNNSVCSMTYSGPKRLVTNNETHCLHPVSSRNKDLVLVPTSECHSKLENFTLFTETNCRDLKYDQVRDWVQIKRMYNQYYVYCETSNLTIGQWSDVCPNYPFVFPFTTTFTINDHLIVGNSMHINHLESEHPIWSVRANWVLKPDKQLQDAMQSLQNDSKLKPIEDVPFHHHSSFPAYSSGGALGFILIACTCFLIYRSYKGTKVEVNVRRKSDLDGQDYGGM